MNKYIVTTDPTCDLGVDLQKKFGVDLVVESYITTPEGVDVKARPAFDFITKDDFYKSIKKNSKNTYKTAAPNLDEVISNWESFLIKGYDILAITISSALSATYNIFVNAQKTLLEKYKDRQIFVIDSLRYSLGLGLLVVKACENRDKGLSVSENYEALKTTKTQVHQMGPMDDLFFLASKGRISQAKAFFGTLVGIKPMGDFDKTGMVTVLTKAKGFDQAYKIILEYVKKTIIDPHSQTLFIANTLREEQAKVLHKLVQEQIKPKEIIIGDIYPVNGINIGPGLLAVYYIGTPMSDLMNEKKIMSEIMESIK